MTSKRLTKSVVDGLHPNGQDYVAWCRQLRGFGCRVRPSGHKSFIAMYRAGGRNSAARKVTIGAYGKITVEEARAEATKILAKAELGNDVAAERARARAEMTVSALCNEYLDEGLVNKKPSTIATDKSSNRTPHPPAARTEADWRGDPWRCRQVPAGRCPG